MKNFLLCLTECVECIEKKSPGCEEKWCVLVWERELELQGSGNFANAAFYYVTVYIPYNKVYDCMPAW